ncbi:MAG TPA: hypothetical protein VLK60_18495, partial [Variovorax sp.]|nr:hypothetical protein [Variovorax sp.]
LAEGGGAPSALATALAPSLAVVAAPAGGGAAMGVRPRATGGAAPARAGIEIESIRGDRRETVSY